LETRQEAQQQLECSPVAGFEVFLGVSSGASENLLGEFGPGVVGVEDYCGDERDLEGLLRDAVTCQQWSGSRHKTEDMWIIVQLQSQVMESLADVVVVVVLRDELGNLYNLVFRVAHRLLGVWVSMCLSG